ncbi:MAG TPA: ATP-binding cassette domain-containing protein [Acetobacteraceae bacterium]|nr:ATP-binding cassette domain-containing protein [Acetobacteraceae bacterium]
MNATPVLEAEHLFLRFGGIRAVHDVSLAVAEGEILAIIGQNGAGKSTFLNMCTGYFRPQGGDIRLAGRSIIGLKPREITRLGVARAFQHPQLFPHRRVDDHIRFAHAAARGGFWSPFRPLESPQSAEEAAELLRFFDLGALAALPARSIPEGARKLLDVAMALALRPKLILLDEPTSGVSSSEKLDLMTRLVTVLRARRVSAVFVEHDMDVVARFADRVAVWVDGEVFRLSTPEKVLADPEVKARVL